MTKFEVWLTVTCNGPVVIPLISARTEFTTDVPLTTVLIPARSADLLVYPKARILASIPATVYCYNSAGVQGVAALDEAMERKVQS
jgi:hypothetical protein